MEQSSHHVVATIQWETIKNRRQKFFRGNALSQNLKRMAGDDQKQTEILSKNYQKEFCSTPNFFLEKTVAIVAMFDRFQAVCFNQDK